MPHLPNGKIVGGHDVSIEDYPYQVALLNNGYFICGGSILNEYFVLTAEHCTGHGWVICNLCLLSDFEPQNHACPPIV